MLRFHCLLRVAPRAALFTASVLAGIAFALGTSGLATAAGADDVRKLVENGQAADAYALCASVDIDAEPSADLWCGITAVDVGRAGVGVLALERFNLRFPEDVRGRLELARAYFYAQDDL